MVNTELVQEFVNSRELRPAVEELSTPADLSAWLGAHGLVEPGARVTTADLAEATRVREALRDMLAAKVGLEVDVAAAKAEIDAAASRAGLELRFDPTCPRVEPTVGGVRGAIGRILVEVYDEMVDGIWERMKACKADDCRWAFLDTSKNKSRTWCSMESCGNRAKVNAYRQRHQHYPAHPHHQ
jgi:predicted RNA-binding Zn ribbon-like protein